MGTQGKGSAQGSYPRVLLIIGGRLRCVSRVLLIELFSLLNRSSLSPGRAMERFVKLLPKRGQPIGWRFAGATTTIGVAVLLQTLTEKYTGVPGLFILLISVFCVAVTFDHGTGTYAAAMTSLAAWFNVFSSAAPRLSIPPAVIVFVFGVGVAFIGEGIRSALERALAAERQSSVLLREMQHRTQNTLAMIVALLEMQARATANGEIRDALKTAAARVRLQSDAHRHLSPQSGIELNAKEYLEEVCNLLQGTLSGIKPIIISCDAENMLVDSQKALALGLIANELVTNAVKYAFPDDTGGRIEVVLRRGQASAVRLEVRDDGVGCPEDAAQGMGTGLVKALVREHRGTFQRSKGSGCAAVVTL